MVNVELLAIQPGDADKAALVERAARICHRSAIAGNPWRFLEWLRAQRHLSVFGHARFCEWRETYRLPGIDEAMEPSYNGYIHSYNARSAMERHPDVALRDIFEREPQLRYTDLTPPQRLKHAAATFEISGISRACSHQIVRHTTMVFTQESQRHVPVDYDECIVPPTIAAHEGAFYLWRDTLRILEDAAWELAQCGIPLEDLRYLTPQAAPTRLVVTARFWSWQHFLDLRLPDDAQWEIRAVAQLVAAALHTAAPEVF